MRVLLAALALLAAAARFELDEKAPSNPAEWTVKDVPQAKALLEQIKGRS